MANVEIFSFSRGGGKGTIVYRKDGGPITETAFPPSMTDEAVLALIGAQVAPKREREAKEAIAEAVPQTVEEPKAKPRQRASAQIEDKRTLRAKYLKDLKAAGIDMKTERSFTKLEAAWKKHCEAPK